MSSSWLKVSCVALGSALALSAIPAVAAPSTHLSSPIVVQPVLRLTDSSPIVVQPILRMASSPIVCAADSAHGQLADHGAADPMRAAVAGSSPIVVQPILRDGQLADRCAADPAHGQLADRGAADSAHGQLADRGAADITLHMRGYHLAIFLSEGYRSLLKLNLVSVFAFWREAGGDLGFDAIRCRLCCGSSDSYIAAFTSASIKTFRCFVHIWLVACSATPLSIFLYAVILTLIFVSI